MHPSTETSWRRHQLVRITAAAWWRIIDTPIDEEGRGWLVDWATFGWPLVVRRAFADESDGIALGIPLPPAAGKRRLAVNVSASDVVSTLELPTFWDVAATAPASWRPCLQWLDLLARNFGVNAGVFGSLAWQFLTGKTYISPDSDLDVAWEMPHPKLLHPFLRQLAYMEGEAPMRFDGEIIRRDGAAVNWREIWRGNSALAVKTAAAVVDCTLDEFLRDAA
jgi:phosphoribosyl-dephospho-CoA transferase